MFATHETGAAVGAPGRTYLLWQDTSSQVLQGDLEAPVDVIVEDLDRDQGIRADRAG